MVRSTFLLGRGIVGEKRSASRAVSAAERGPLGRSETGQALVVALVVMSALTISIGAIISFVTGSEGLFGRDQQSVRAFHVAEAGVNNGIAVVAMLDPDNLMAPMSRLPTGSGSYPIALDNSTGTYFMEKYPAGDPNCTAPNIPSTTPCWTIVGAGVSPNGRVARQIQETIYWRTTVRDDSAPLKYGLFVDNQGGACVDTHGTTALTIKDVWISGDFCPAGGVDMTPPAPHRGSVYIGGV